MSLSLSHWVLGQVGDLIVSIPDLCTLTYFESNINASILHIWAFFVIKLAIEMVSVYMLLKIMSNECVYIF